MDIDTPHAFCDVRLGRIYTYLDKKFISKHFLSFFPPDRINNLRILDVGAGKGRMLQHFVKYAKYCVALEPFLEFYNILINNFSSTNIQIYQKPLQSFKTDDRFDLIFISGVLPYLDDEEMLDFMGQARTLLCNDGFIIIRDLSPYKGYTREFKEKETIEILRKPPIMISNIERSGFKLVYYRKAYPSNPPYKLYLSYPNRLTEVIWKILSHKTVYPLWQLLAELDIRLNDRGYYLYLIKVT
jgi:SAM-dependent methyltransferase